MTRFLGAPCPVCEKPFAAGDDIVVCPTCGTPHHRTCYKETGHCAQQHMHGKGAQWGHPKAEPQQEEKATRSCPRCAALNPPDGIFCEVCGVRLVQPKQGQQPGFQQPQQQQPPFGGQAQQPGSMSGAGYTLAYNPEQQVDEDIKAKELAAFVGNSSPYFLLRFLNAERTTGWMGFNIGAFLFNFLYFFYRKMYALAIPLLLLFLLTLVPWAMYSYEYFSEMASQFGRLVLPPPQLLTASMQQLLPIMNAVRWVQIGLALASGMLANKVYFSHCIKNIRRIKAQAGGDTAGYISRLNRSGGVSPGAVSLVVFAITLGYFLYSYYIMYAHNLMG